MINSVQQQIVNRMDYSYTSGTPSYCQEFMSLASIATMGVTNLNPPVYHRPNFT